jgi:hypothetical protein
MRAVLHPLSYHHGLSILDFLKGVAMNWKVQLNKAIDAVKNAAEGETAQNMAAKAKQATSQLVQKAQSGALDAAQAFIEANTDPAAFKCQFLNVKLSVLAPSNGLEISTPSEGSVVITDGEENGLVINAAAKPPYVLEMIGTVTQLNANTYDLGSEDGINVVLIEA